MRKQTGGTAVHGPARDRGHGDEASTRFGVTVDQRSEWSFPASDPPATWTWDVPARRRPAHGLSADTVVVGYDGSPAAERALGRAAALVGTDGRVVLVVASHSPSSGGVTSEPILDTPGPKERTALLARGRAVLGDHQVRATLVASDDDPAGALIEAARAHGAEFILVGRTGAGYVTRTILGSTAANVLRRAPCDVVVVR